MLIWLTVIEAMSRTVEERDLKQVLNEIREVQEKVE